MYRYDHDHSLVTLRSLPDWTFAPRWSSNCPLQSSLCKETRWPVDTSNRRHGRSALYSLIRCPQTYSPCRHGLSQERSTEFVQHWPGLVSLMISVSRPQFWVSKTLTLYQVLDWTVHMARIIKCVEVLRPMYYHFTDFSQSERLDLYRSYAHKLLEVRAIPVRVFSHSTVLCSQAMDTAVSVLQTNSLLRGKG